MSERTRAEGPQSALALLTSLGGAVVPGPRTLDWFPLVGAAIGAAVGGVWWAAANFWLAPIAAALTLAADAILTGGLHYDGLADTADGLLPPLSRERRLEVMRDPRSGAFALLTLSIIVALRITAFASTPPSWVSVAAIWCASRTAMALGARLLP